MDCKSTRISYLQTGAFSKIAMDYVAGAESLKPFISYPATPEGIKQSIAARQAFKTNRQMLVEELKKQYTGINEADEVLKNIELLLSPDTFTITTAHQNNIFTGPLYFIYKIIHTIRLASHLNETMAPYKFVPVYYIGSEDADVDELNHIYLGSEKIIWNTKQTGAVGRMKVDRDLLKLIDTIAGQLGVLPHGAGIIEKLRSAYQLNSTIQDSTFRFVHDLFKSYGLVILLPDNARLKQLMIPVFENDLLKQSASTIVEQTSSKLAALYKVQAHPREINLFYLDGDKRERIELREGEYHILNTDLTFTREQILEELKNHPEKFSPNVILRGLYQETILPNIAFIGGGGELAYWMELKDLFGYFQTPYPVLVLRNSFLIIREKQSSIIQKLRLSITDIFKPRQEILNHLVMRDTDRKLQLNGTLTTTEKLFEEVKEQAASIDVTLTGHVEALRTRTVRALRELEKKMLRAEKRKFSDQQRQVSKIKSELFPNDGLQERYESMLGFYAAWGPVFIDCLYKNSLALEQEFVILEFNG